MLLSLSCSFGVVFLFPHSTALPVLFLHECCVLQVASLFTWGHAGFQRASFLCAKQELGLSRRTCRPKFIVSLAWHKSLNASHSWRHWMVMLLIICLQYQCIPKALSPHLFSKSFYIQTACCGMIEVGVLSTSLGGFSSTAVNHRTMSLWLQTCPFLVSILAAVC